MKLWLLIFYLVVIAVCIVVISIQAGRISTFEGTLEDITMRHGEIMASSDSAMAYSRIALDRYVECIDSYAIAVGVNPDVDSVEIQLLPGRGLYAHYLTTGEWKLIHDLSGGGN